MREAGVFSLLVLAASVALGGQSVSRVSVPDQQPVGAICRCPFRAAPPAAGVDERYPYEVRGSTLRRTDRPDPVLAGYATGVARTGTSPGMPVWKQAGVCALELAVAELGTLVAEAGGLATVEGVYQAGWNGPGSVPGATAYFLTSALLSAGTTHLTGKLLGRGNQFRRALAGGAAGGFLGGAAFADYFVTRRNPHSFMMPVALVLPPLAAVIAYNVWRNDGTR